MAVAPKKTSLSKSTAKPKAPAKKQKAPVNQHLKELKRESRRVKGLYDPTARSGFKYGKGTE